MKVIMTFRPPKGDYSSALGRLGGVSNIQIESEIFNTLCTASNSIENN